MSLLCKRRATKAERAEAVGERANATRRGGAGIAAAPSASLARGAGECPIRHGAYALLGAFWCPM